MSENFPLKLLNNFCCSVCKFQFFIKDFTLKGSRCPMLLHCGHSMCSHCLQVHLKGTNSITCQLCGFLSSWESSEAFNKCFPLNIYMLGSLFVFQNSKLEKDKRLAFLAKKHSELNYALLGQSDITMKANTSDSICEECLLKASWHCENCQSNFCEICWARVHSSAKSLTKHVRTSISERASFEKCKEHKTQILEFFCEDCSRAVCSHCIIVQHQGQGHHSISLKEKNLEMFNKVKRAFEDAEKISRQMKQTLEEITLKQTAPEPPESKSYLDMENQINRNFSRIHGILQLEEERLLKKLHEKSNERENCLRTLQTQLEKQLEDVERLLRESNSALKKPQNSDLTLLHQQLIEVKNLPVCLVPQKSDNKEAKLEFDERLIDLIRVYCHMDPPSDELFELCSSSDLSEDYVAHSLNNLSLNENTKEDIETSSSCSSKELPKEDNELINNLSGFPMPKVFLEKKTYCVRTSFIKSPGEFYVTLNSQRAKQRAIDKRASAVARSSSDVPQTYGKDEIYLVQYQVDKKWYRGRVMEVISSKRSGGENSVVVYYLDYGNFETVPITKLRLIPPDLLEEPPLAIKCKLFDCVPQNDEWCPDSTKIMEKILKNNTATMFVMKVLSDCLEVDLSTMYTEGKIGRDIVSVRDALMFLGFSLFVEGFRIHRNATAFKYLDQSLPSVGETFDVTVTHINSPSDFYVQKTLQDASYLYKLTVDMQTYYKENRDKGMIYNPSLDMPCAALFSADQNWYRAKIVNVPGKKIVTVFYVDYGNKETIQWTQIRKLKECFAKCPPMAFNCAMAGIFPVHGMPWSIQAKSYLKKNILMRDAQIFIQGKSKSGKKLKVLLYKKENKKDVCLNNSFVNVGIAVHSCEQERLCVMNSREKEEDLVLKTDERNSDSETESSQIFEETNKNFQTSDIIKDRKKNKLNAKELRELHESEKQNHTEEEISSEPVQNEIDQCKSIFKVKVDVLSAESPSSIYVTFPTLMAEFENLQAELNEFYQDSKKDSVEEWTIGSICAVFDSAKSCWYRASVLAFLPDDRVQVFLKDVARVISEPVSALRTLDPFFKKYSLCSVKCQLADVRPPGKDWPSLSCRYLSEELEKHKEVYMTKRGQTKSGSLPVQLWVQKVLSRGALEPIKKEWVTLNRLLVSQGLAVPANAETWSELDHSSVEDDECSEGEKSLDNGNNEAENIESSSYKTDLNDDLKDESKISKTFVPSLGSQWIPALPLKRSSFIGIPTYVDLNAIIYMYDIEQDEENLQIIRETLFEEYGNSKPNVEDHFWIPGQLCIAKYHADNYWYRGLVVQELEDLTCDVLFVDYGNTENCQIGDLRKRIKTQEIPIITHKFQLHGIETLSEDGEWPEHVIDILHSFIVDKKCEVNVLKSPQSPDEAYIITLRVIESDTDVATFLIEKNLASLGISSTDFISSDNNSFHLPSEVVDDPVDSSRYIPLNITDFCKEFFIEITTWNSETEFFANIVIDESLPSSLKKILTEFESLQQELTENCHLQPLIENLLEGLPCCCLDFANNKWCRGEIESFHKTSVCVTYVDYGTKEILHEEFIRECKDSWINLPKMAVKFKLGGIEKCSNTSESVYRNALTSCLSGRLFAEILKSHENSFEVRLLTTRDGPLAYQKMIDEGLMKFV